ncbi:LolA-related protein [Pseudomonas sp. NyZ704]|nr:LolA-related protein [Pseudomonas sp. NyZ704]
MTPFTHRCAHPALVFACSIMVATMAQAAPDAAALSQQLAQHSPECGTFQQNRWLADFELDLPSSGSFQRLDQALIWRTETPVQTEIRLSQDNAELPPGYRMLLPVMTALLEGDWQRLQDHFQIVTDGELSSWAAKLTPLDSRVAATLPSIKVKGGQQLVHIAMAFADGDRLNIDLTPATCEPDPAPQAP